MQPNEHDLIVFTDGSSLGNPGVGGWGAVLIYQKLDELVELGGLKAQTTNNEMELTAIVSALSYAINGNSHMHIYTDSQYAINGITQWMYGWVKNGWKTKEKEDIKNKEIWQRLFELVQTRGKDTLHFHHVSGHVGIPGNERVDTIARGLAEGNNISLYRGKLSLYPIPNILHLPNEAQREQQREQKKSGKAYSYLALIDGKVERFATWAECESRVTGRSAKFKKALSREHEEEILKEWGVQQ